GSGFYEIFSATVGGAGTAINRSHASAQTMPYTTTGGGGNPPIQITSSGRVVYRGSDTTNAADFSVYEFNLADASVGTVASHSRVANMSVVDFSTGLGKTFFAIDQAVDEIFQLFSLVPGTAGQTEIGVLGPNLYSISEVHIMKPGEGVPALP